MYVCICVLGDIHFNPFQATHKVAHGRCLCVLRYLQSCDHCLELFSILSLQLSDSDDTSFSKEEHLSKWLFWPSTNASSRTPFILTACFQQLPTLSNSTNQKEQRGRPIFPGSSQGLTHSTCSRKAVRLHLCVLARQSIAGIVLITSWVLPMYNLARPRWEAKLQVQHIYTAHRLTTEQTHHCEFLTKLAFDRGMVA